MSAIRFFPPRRRFSQRSSTPQSQRCHCCDLTTALGITKQRIIAWRASGRLTLTETQRVFAGLA